MQLYPLEGASGRHDPSERNVTAEPDVVPRGDGAAGGPQLAAQRRAAALRHYRVLDTPPEEPFDRITRLAAHLLEAPVAQITLVDEDRQWVKSAYGRDREGVEEARAGSRCVRAVQSPGVAVVEDATQEAPADPPHARFYAAAPLQAPGGVRIGTLCVFDTQPRELSTDQEALLVDLAATAMDELELRRSREEAEQASQMKEAIINNMGHEIRTPLASMIGFADVLVEQLKQPEEAEASEAEAKQVEFARIVRRSAERLQQTLESVLTLAQLKANEHEFNRQAVDVRVQVRQAVDVHRPKAQKKGLTLRADVPAEPSPCARADRDALSRVLTHLIENAIKFTREEGSVTVQAGHASASETVTEKRPQGMTTPVFVRVRDTGVGISEAFRPHLFEEFKQESTGLSRKYQGAGLGLSITKRLVEQMDGLIHVESTKEEGAVFTVFLPRARPS